MQSMPLAGMFCESRDEAKVAPMYPLSWVKCRKCGLVQVLEEIAEDLLYGRYSYASSTVPGLVRHFSQYAQDLISRYSTQSRIHFLEIGCNDGVLLNRLPESWELLGVDPSDVARTGPNVGENYHLLDERFTTDLVDREKLQGKFDVVSGSNCLAHIADLKDVFTGVYRSLRLGGHFWLEVHDLDALLQGKQWDTIYHEHKVEWSVTSLRRCLLPLGFTVVGIWRHMLHGGSLRACFRKESQPQSVQGAPILEDQLKELQLVYKSRYDSPAVQTLVTAQANGKKISAFGAAGRANVYLNQLSDLKFKYVVDESPLRVNKFLPGIGTPVVGLDRFQSDPTDICLITAWNYADDIKRNKVFHGRWLTAFEMPS
jgi:SAM-dependent methyltransferase